MKCEDYDFPLASIHSLRHAPSCSSLATSASTSGWSDASSQKSDDSCTTASSDSDSCEPYCLPRASQDSLKLCNPWAKQQLPQLHLEVPAELRQNPRRTSCSTTSRTGCPPSLVRQADRKVNFVDNLVDSSTQIVEAIWPTSSVPCRNEAGVLPLRTFIQETLRRSRTSYSTLQVALYYLILIKPHVPAHDFTMEQPDDCHTSRVLQCGRRMFLAALILASKYLQDRNYSARAWSKISGLNTQEINQNEMTFLLAVNWKLHITDEVYNRWTDCVMKHTPSQPPSPGGSCQLRFERQCEDFKNIILRLTPELDNLDEILPCSPTRATVLELPAMPTPRALFTPSVERTCAFACESNEATPTPKPYGTPMVMEPNPATVHTPGRLAPALGLLPTPRLTPQTGGFCTPAVSAAPYFLGKASSMGFAMAQVGGVAAVQNLDRWPGSTSSSPQSYVSYRRSSLANMSTASSPESMISDSSRTSRSSSISSASSLASAPAFIKLDVQARCRSAKLLFGERLSLRPSVASVPEDYEESCLTSSPESYAGPVGKDLCELSLDTTPLAKREREMDDPMRDPVNDAARALQELHDGCHGGLAPAAPYQQQQQSQVAASSCSSKANLKRSRAVSIENSLHENVRDMLNGRIAANERVWSDSLIRARFVAGCETALLSQQLPVRATPPPAARKRLCCSTEAVGQQYQVDMPSLHPAVGGIGGPGMWAGILN